MKQWKMHIAGCHQHTNENLDRVVYIYLPEVLLTRWAEGVLVHFLEVHPSIVWPHWKWLFPIPHFQHNSFEICQTDRIWSISVLSLNLFCRHFSSVGWSSMSNTADRSTITRHVVSCLSILGISFLTWVSAVLVLCEALKADWNFSLNPFRVRLSTSWSATNLSTSLEIYDKLLTGQNDLKTRSTPFFFINGLRCASFIFLENSSDSKDTLIMHAVTGVNTSAIDLSSVVGIGSSLQLLDVNSLIPFLTPFSEIPWNESISEN